jgi:aminoglycoside 3-N-acetyltransferase
MPASSFSKDQLIRQMLDLGVQPGGILVVHTSFSKVKPVENGPMGLIDALKTALTPAGTLVMPSMSWEDDEIFDPETTPSPEMGIVADTFWRLPGVLRGNTAHAFAAFGPVAPQITASQPIDKPHGLDSPVGRVYELDGQVLLLGVDPTSNTTIHLAEALAGVRYRRPKYLTILDAGKPIRFDYEEIDHCCQNFNLVDAWLDEKGLQRKGKIGHADARLMRSQDVVETIVPRLKQDDTIFLHPEGVDEECDEARASLA